MLCSIDAATRAVFRVFGAVEVVEDEPQALISATQARAATAPMPPRRTRRTRAAIGVVGSECMRAY